MIGRLRTVVVDCPDPRALADFYAGLIGGDVDADDEDWVVLNEPKGTRLAFQRSPEHEPPSFPDPRASQQFHLDVEVEDPDDAEQQALALGAARVPGVGNEFDDPFRVFRDPAGHTFCLVWGV